MSPVTCSSNDYDGIVFPVLLTPVAVSISSFKSQEERKTWIVFVETMDVYWHKRLQG